MPPLQQTQKEKHQSRRTTPYRRPPPRLATLELFGTQFEWTQAQQLHSNTVENEWQNMTSNEFGDNTNDYDDNEKPSIKQVGEPKEVLLMLIENSSRRSDINTKRGVNIGVEQNDSMVQPLEVPVLANKWSNIINNNNNNGQFNNNNIITNNSRQFGGYIAQNSGQINNIITNSNGPNSIIANSNGRNSVIASNIGRNGIININSNINRNSVITNNNNRNSMIGRNSRNVITNTISRNNAIASNINRNNTITSNIRNNAINRHSAITSNINHNSVTTNNVRNAVIANNNSRNNVIANLLASNNIVRSNTITNSQFSNYVSQNSNQASKSFVVHNNGQVGNGFLTHNNSQVCNSFVTHNNSQASNSFVTHNSNQFSNSQFNNSQFNNSQFSNSQFSNSQFSNSQFNNSQFGNNQFSNSQSNKSIITNNSSNYTNNSSIVNTNSNGNKINNSQVDKSNVANDSKQVSSKNFATSNSVQVSNGDNSKVSNSIVTSNINQVSSITVTENNNKVDNDSIATNKSSEVSNDTFTNNNSNMSNNNNNEIDSTEQPEGSTVISDGISPGVSGRSRKRRNGKGQGRRVRRRKRRSDVRDQDQSQTTTANTEDIKEHPVEETGNVNKRRKIVSENDDEGLAMNVDGNEEVVSTEDPNADNVDTMTATITEEQEPPSSTEPHSSTEPPPSTRTPARAKSRSSRSKKRRNDRKNSAARKPRGKRGRTVPPSGTSRTEDAHDSDQDEQLESMSDVPQSLVAPAPDVPEPEPEPEPKQTIALRKYLETLCLDEQILSRDRLLRLGMFILDYFVSQAWCRPFVNPEDESAVIYRQIITRLMDLSTVERNLWAGEYDGAVSKFYNDLAQIIYNAFKFHPEGSIIFNEANLMLTCFVDLTTKFSKPPHDLDELDVTLAQAGAKLPHEEFGDVCSVSPNIESRIYIVPLYSFRQVSRSGSNVAKLPQAAAERLDPMSRPLFDIFERRNLPPVRFQPTETHCNFARLYITMGAQNIKKCRDERNAILVIVKDVSYARGENRLRCNAVISKPFGELRELDTIGFPELQDARYWTRVAFLDRVTLDLKVGPKFFDKYLRTPFKVSEYDKEKLTSQQHDAFLAALNLRQGNLSDGLSIWQRLVAEANRVKVPVESFESLGKSIQVDAEGFFKRVFHVPGDDKYVVQNFKEISEGTLETRIKEAVCCLKTKGVSNTGQIRSVYKDEEYDELVGLSMERYNYTLKEYAFNTRSPITGEQKFRLIHDMVKGIKALHDAGFAHRDLSEVNMMVNNTTEKLADGSIKPELVVIDFGKAEFINRDDVLAWSVGEVTSEKLEHLPWIKTVPDHGYKLYRSAATLPRTKNDHAVLQYPIDPCSEDVYAAGVLAWRIFSGQAPWGGILDTDLKNLREIVTDPIKIKFHIEKNVNGKKSRELLLKCITATSQERSTAKELLDWLLQCKDELISEWAISGRMRIRKQL